MQETALFELVNLLDIIFIDLWYFNLYRAWNDLCKKNLEHKK